MALTANTAQAFQFRMPAGFPGTVNRSHPASIEPNVSDPSTPPALVGLAGVYSSTGTVRQVAPGDTAIAGVVVRAYPVQDAGYNETFGATGFGPSAVPAGWSIDLLTWGYVIVQVNSNGSALVNGSPVYVWSAASSAPHVQGGFEGTNPGGSGFQVARAYFRGAADANGYVEMFMPPV